MTIGIDARLISQTGVGRYIRNLIRELSRLDRTSRYIVFLSNDAFHGFILPNARWEKRLADVPWHTVKEQFVLPWLFVREHLDLLHVPYVTIPIFYPGRMIVTMHDLTNLHVDTGKATTLPLWQYKLRRLGYYVILAVGLQRAAKILAVSQATKQEIMQHFQIPDEKIVVTYEGVDEKLKVESPLEAKGKGKWKVQKRLVNEPYFLYVGNVYPHKNVSMLLAAFRTYQGDAKLVFVGKDDFFYRRLKKEVQDDTSLCARVQFVGEAHDDALQNLYTHAIVLVFPSLMEGFGLPALEALSFSCPVICSDIPVFHEILGDMPLYIDSGDTLAHALVTASTTNLRTKAFEEKAKRCVANYTWSSMAKRTLQEYTA